MGQVTLLMSLVLGCGRQADVHTAVLLSRVWRVDAEGKIAPFPFNFPKGSDGSLQGSTVPLPSPDGRWIAYGDPGGDWDAHLLDVRTLHQRRITRLGRPPTISSVWVDVLLDGWSPDSRRLLLDVTAGEDTSESGDLKVPAACYGFREYDVASQKLTGIALPKGFQFVAWLRDGRLLGVIPGQLPRDDRLVMLQPREAREVTVGAVVGWPIQAQVSADGKWLVGIHANDGREFGAGTAEIVKVNLRTMSAASLVSLNSWSGNERPALSPDDKRVAYIYEVHRMYDVPKDSLFVDGREIYSCPNTIGYQWVGSKRIALACVKSPFPLEADFMTLDASTGHVISKYNLSPTEHFR